MSEEKLVDIGNNIKLAVKITGDIMADTPTILFANGSIFNYKQFDLTMIPKLMDYISEDEYSLIQYDYVGIGNSSNLQGQYDFLKLAEQQIKLVETLELESVHIFGYSKGSVVSQIMTAMRPDLVSSFTGLGNPNLAYDESNNISKTEFSLRYQNSLSLKGIWKDQVDDKNFRLVYDTIYVPSIFGKQVFQLGFIERIKNWWIRKRIQPMLMGTVIENMAKLFDYYTRDVTDEEKERYINAIKSIKVPTLLMHGKEDETVPISGSRKLHEWIGTSNLVEIPKLSHSEPLFLGGKANLVMQKYAGFLESLMI